MNPKNSNITNIYENEDDYIYSDANNLNKIKTIFRGKSVISNKYIIICFSILFILYIILIVDRFTPINKSDRDNIKIAYNRHNKIKDFNFEVDFNKPVLPDNQEEIIRKNYFKSYYNTTNIRYHFFESFQNRKLFKINYNYLPYEKIDKSKSYDENANYIYETTGMLNITKLDLVYNNQKFSDTLNFNHIHLSMGHDSQYILLSLVSIASILNTTSNDTYIHFHFILLDCKFEDMKPIIALKEIYNNVDFIFYNGKQAEYDFVTFGNRKGVGDYTRFLIPEIVNNTNRIIILDSADIIAKKDLSEIYYFDIENNYFAFALDIYAGKDHKYYVFAINNFYANMGISLVNVRLFRKDNLYMAGYFTRLAYHHLPCPTQEMFFLVSQYKIKFFPLIYNYPQLFNNEMEINNKIYNNSLITFYMKGQENSPFKYTIEEIVEAESNHIVSHLFTAKPYYKQANEKNGKIWVNYSKLSKTYEKLKIKYPEVFKLYEK